jgi:hypothetical protein
MPVAYVRSRRTQVLDPRRQLDLRFADAEEVSFRA